MLRDRSWRSVEDDTQEANRQTASLAAVAVVLLLIVVGLFLVQTLRSKGRVEDCLMAGRRNCDAVVAYNL